MKRREFLGAMVSVPLIGAAKPVEAGTSISMSQPLNKWAGPNPLAEPEDFFIPEPQLSWKEMAERLWVNMEKYIAYYEAKHEQQWDETEKRHMQAINYRMCRNLLDGFANDEPVHSDWKGDHSRHYYPDQDPDLIKKVRFVVSQGPMAIIANPHTYKQEVAPCQARKLKLRYNPHMMDDLSVFCGIDAEVECVACWGHEAALDIAMEIRGILHRDNKLIHTYAIYLPPFLTPKVPPTGDWSFNRGFRMRYAKFS